MEKNISSQLELFSQSKGLRPIRTSSPIGFFVYMRRYEKILIITIGFIITGIISFSLGVRRGRDIATLKLNSRMDIAATQKIPQDSKDADTQITSPRLTEQERLDAYTIQVASYSTDTYAQKEAQVLKKKGFTTLILPKGKYIILCVGKFSDKKSAETLLSQLSKQKRYQGCLIRKL